MSCRQSPVLSSQHLVQASKGAMAPGLVCISGKWLKPVYKHGMGKQKEVVIGNQGLEMASESTKVNSSPPLLHLPIPSLLRQPKLLLPRAPGEVAPGSGHSRTSEKPLPQSTLAKVLTTHDFKELTNLRERFQQSSMPRKYI